MLESLRSHKLKDTKGALQPGEEPLKTKNEIKAGLVGDIISTIYNANMQYCWLADINFLHQNEYPYDSKWDVWICTKCKGQMFPLILFPFFLLDV